MRSLLQPPQQRKENYYHLVRRMTNQSKNLKALSTQIIISTCASALTLLLSLIYDFIINSYLYHSFVPIT